MKRDARNARGEDIATTARAAFWALAQAVAVFYDDLDRALALVALAELMAAAGRLWAEVRAVIARRHGRPGKD
jgi:hypothetical protein